MRLDDLPRAPGELPLLGSILPYLRAPLPFFEETARRGDLVAMRFLHQRAVVVNEPALVEQILVKQAPSFGKDLFVRQLRRVLGNGLLTNEGEPWKRQRRLAQPAFHRERVAAYGRLMVEHTRARAERWRPGEVLDLHHEAMALTADIVTHALFGTTTGDTGEVASCIETIMVRFSDPAFLFFPSLARLPLPINRRVDDAMARLDRVVRGFVAARRDAGGADTGDDLLGMLLAARDEDGSRMDDQQVRDEVLILFLAGHETTALALSWAFHLLAASPAARSALHAELDEVLGDRDPTVEDLPRLRFTEGVALETLRLRPPAWSLGREALAPVELGGTRFEAGTWFWILPWTLHRDPRTFDAPLAFRPERWADGLAKRLPRGAFLPFGAGPRICIGNQFAMMELVLLLATIARRFTLSAVPGQRVEPEPSITLRFTEGLRMRLDARPPAGGPRAVAPGLA